MKERISNGCLLSSCFFFASRYGISLFLSLFDVLIYTNDKIEGTLSVCNIFIREKDYWSRLKEEVRIVIQLRANKSVRRRKEGSVGKMGLRILLCVA